MTWDYNMHFSKYSNLDWSEAFTYTPKFGHTCISLFSWRVYCFCYSFIVLCLGTMCVLARLIRKVRVNGCVQDFNKDKISSCSWFSLWVASSYIFSVFSMVCLWWYCIKYAQNCKYTNSTTERQTTDKQILISDDIARYTMCTSAYIHEDLKCYLRLLTFIWMTLSSYHLFTRLFMLNFHFNPLRAMFFTENINIWLHFMSFFHTKKTRVVEIPPRVKQRPTYST